MAAHQPHFAYCGGGEDGCVTFQFQLVGLVCPTIIKKMKTETEQKIRQTIIYLIMIIIIMRGENFVAHRLRITGRVLKWAVLKRAARNRNVANWIKDVQTFLMTALSLWTLHKYLVSKIRSVVVLLTPCIC
jgi:hypothetical protein